MAKVLGRDYTAGSLGDNATGTTRTSTAYVTDFEGLVKPCLAKEHRFAGLRRIWNELTPTEDLSGYRNATTNFTITDDAATSPMGRPAQKFQCKGVSSTENFDVYPQRYGQHDGVDIEYSIYVKNIDATSVSLLFAGNWTKFTFSTESWSGSNSADAWHLPLANGWYRIGITGYKSNKYHFEGFSIDYNSITTTAVYVTGISIVLVEGQTNQNPGDYVSAGVYRENLLINSANISGSGWNNFQTTDATGVVAGPFGDLDADELIASPTNNLHSIRQGKTLIANTDYVLSTYIKSSNSDNFGIALYDNTGGRAVVHKFHADDGTEGTAEILGTGLTVKGSGIESVGNGWYRIYSSINSGTNTSFDAYFYILGPSDERSFLAVDESLYMTRSQLELGTTPTDWIYNEIIVNKDYGHGQGINNDIAVEYFDYENPNTVSSNVVNPTGAPATPITGGHLLLEPAGTQRLADWDMATEEDDWSHTGLASVAAYTGDSPVQGVTAYTHTETSSNEAHYNQARPNSSSYTSGNDYTVSVYAKAGTRDDIALYFPVDAFPSADRSAHFDLTAGTTSYSGTGTATIEATGYDGWYFCTYTQTADATATGYAGVFAMSDGSSIIYTGNGSTVHFCAPQSELGAVATSRIACSGTAGVNRTADTKISYPLTTPQSAGMAVIKLELTYDSADNSAGNAGVVSFDTSGYQGPIYRASGTIGAFNYYDITNYPGTGSAAFSAGQERWIASRWDDAADADGESQVGYSDDQSTWNWGTAGNADGTFQSSSEIQIAKDTSNHAYKIIGFDIYDTDEGTSWIDSNYPASSGVTGNLSTQEPGSDTAALTGDVHVSGTLTVQETGADGATITGTVLVAGTLSVQEIGSDTATIIGTAPSGIAGTLTAQESGFDVAAIVGNTLIIGTLATQEVGSDTATINGTAPAEITGTLDVTEAGSDTATILGQVQIAGTLAAQETGSDTAAIYQSQVFTGTLTVQESGIDSASVGGLIGGTTEFELQFVVDAAYSVHAIPAVYTVGGNASICRFIRDVDAQLVPGGVEIPVRADGTTFRVRTTEISTPTKGATINFKGVEYRVDGYERIDQLEWIIYGIA